jgi:hypothetical protein
MSCLPASCPLPQVLAWMADTAEDALSVTYTTELRGRMEPLEHVSDEGGKRSSSCCCCCCCCCCSEPADLVDCRTGDTRLIEACNQPASPAA